MRGAGSGDIGDTNRKGKRKGKRKNNSPSSCGHDSIVKRRFKLLKLAPEYDIDTQAQFVPALCALHNFIRLHDPKDIPKNVQSDFPQAPGTEDFGHSITHAEKRRANDRRDRIAQAMWDSYQNYINSHSQ